MKTGIDRSIVVGVVTPDELEQAHILQKRFDTLSALAQSITHDALTERYRKVLAAFEADPTSETLEELKRAEMEKEFFHVHTRVRVSVRALIKNFQLREVREWAVPVVKKALTAARENLARVTESEKTRHRRLTGRELGRSEVIELAARPVTGLEVIWGHVETIDASAQKKEVQRLSEAVDRAKSHYDELRADPGVNGKELAAAARDYDDATKALHKAEASLAAWRLQLAGRRLYAPSDLLTAITAAADPLQTPSAEAAAA